MQRAGVVAAFSMLAGGAAIAAWGVPAASIAQGVGLPSPCPTTWCTTHLAPGVTWSYRTAGLPSGVPRVNVVEIDPAKALVRAVESSAAPKGYETVPHMAQRTHALVGINGGFFDNVGSPPPFRFVSMLKLAGVLKSPNPTPRPALGVAGTGTAFSFAVEPVAAGTPDPLASYLDAVGAGPFFINPSPQPSAGVVSWSSDPGGFDWVCSAHPRSAAWLLANGHLMLGAFDGGEGGKPNDGLGFWLDTPTSPFCNGTSPQNWNGISLGAFILQNFPTTVQAMNLDGGGSTTFVVNGNVVNGQSNGVSPRAVIDGLMVWAKSAASI